jgi:hypothetical protein
MPPHLREIALRGFQGPAVLRLGGLKEVLRLRGPPGNLKHRSNRRTQHPSGGGSFFSEKVGPFSERINTGDRDHSFRSIVITRSGVS